MRIGHYAPRPAEQGGIGTYIRRTGRAQSRRGHEVVYLGRELPSGATLPGEAVTVPETGDLFCEAETLQLDVLHLHKGVPEIPIAHVPTVRAMHGHQGGCPSGSRYLARTGKPCDRDFTWGGCLWGHLVDRCGSARPGNLLSNFSRIQREIRQAQQIPTYTVSGFLSHRMVRAGCPADALTTIPSPAPKVSRDREPVPRGDVPRFLYLGRLVPQKGPGWLLRALAETDVPAHVDIAGDGPRRSDLERLARDLGIDPDVTFHGWVDRDRVPLLMDRCRAVVFPSRWHEPAGLITLEAAAHGRALIASRVGGIPEYADEAHSFLVEPGDTQALAEALSHLATDADRADRMGKRGRAVAQSDFAVSPFLDRLDTLYNRAVADQDTPDDHTPTSREMNAKRDEC